MSVDSVRCAINLFLDAIGFSTKFTELHVKLPDPKDHDAVHDLAQRWPNVSSVNGLFNHNLGTIYGWLPRTEMPNNIRN